jgi:signal transduction histidine kinase
MFEALRWRLTAWYVFVFAVVFAVVGVIVFVWASHRFAHDVDSPIRAVSDAARMQVASSADIANGDAAVRRVLADASLSGSADVFVLLLNPNGDIAANPSDVPTEGLPDRASVEAAKRTGDDWRGYSLDALDLRVRTTAVYRNGQLTGFVQAGKSVEERDASLRTLAITIVGGGLTGLALATIGGLFVAGIAILPVKRSFNRQREFVADASHELRTPLAVIRVNAESAAGSTSAAEAMGDIADEAAYMTRLLDDLLLLAGSDREGIDLKLSRVDLADVVRDTARATSGLASTSGIALTVNAPAGLPVEVDAERVRQVILILLDNALKYTARGGSIVVEAARSGDEAVVKVRDSGIGIAPEDVERVFDRFYRVDKARSRAAGGAGLGLSIAREIVDAHHGHLKLESEPGRGTTASLRLPLAVTPQPAAAAP